MKIVIVAISLVAGAYLSYQIDFGGSTFPSFFVLCLGIVGGMMWEQIKPKI